MSLEEKTLQSKEIFRGRIISLQVDEVLLPNGQKSERELVKHPGAVAVIPFTADDKLVLVRQYRKALEKELYEIPAGKLEPGENPLECARRELEEETGYASEQMRRLTSFYTSPGFADEIIFLYEATQLNPGKLQLDEDEFVELHIVTLEEALKLIEEQKIQDAKTAYAVLYWQLKRLQARA